MDNFSIAQAIQDILDKYTGSKRLLSDTRVQWANPGMLQDRQWAEHYPVDEPGPPHQPNPFYGTNTIVLNEDKIRGTGNPEVLEETILGDSLHNLPNTNPALYNRFSSGADEKYLSAMRERQAIEGDNRPFEQWRKRAGDDAMIRGALLQNYPAHRRQGWSGIEKRFPFSKQQYMALGDIKRSIGF